MTNGISSCDPKSLAAKAGELINRGRDLPCDPNDPDRFLSNPLKVWYKNCHQFGGQLPPDVKDIQAMIEQLKKNKMPADLSDPDDAIPAMLATLGKIKDWLDKH
jgi:hypothetical protein